MTAGPQLNASGLAVVAAIGVAAIGNRNLARLAAAIPAGDDRGRWEFLRDLVLSDGRIGADLDAAASPSINARRRRVVAAVWLRDRIA